MRIGDREAGLLSLLPLRRSMQLLARLVDTFGPFLIPATLFVVGVAGYAVLWLLTGRGEDWSAEDEAEG